MAASILLLKVKRKPRGPPVLGRKSWAAGGFSKDPIRGPKARGRKTSIDFALFEDRKAVAPASSCL